MRALPALATLIVAGTLSAPLGADETPAPRSDCSAPSDVTRLGGTLSRFTDRLLHREPVKIVAFGSSSTEGAGASTIENNYPSQLLADLRARFPGISVEVINRGVGGEDAREMLVRIDRDVNDEHPDLVLWQVGTNALLREDGVAQEAKIIRDGITRIRTAGADVMLIDPQYAPKVLRDPDAEPMVALLATIATDTGIPIFHRFELMRYWRERGIPFEAMLSPDLLHMNDWSYHCFATTLARSLVMSFKDALARAKPQGERTVNAQVVAPQANQSAAVH